MELTGRSMGKDNPRKMCSYPRRISGQRIQPADQGEIAHKFLLAERARLDPLVDHAMELLLEAEGNCGSCGFRNSCSPAIRLAAEKAVEEKDGVAMIPFESSLLCECSDGQEHRL